MATIYISGGFYGKYKEKLLDLLDEHHVIIDPERDPNPSMRIPGRYVGRDLDDIESKAQIVLAVQTDYPYVYGMAAEVGYAAGFVRGMAHTGCNPSIDVIYLVLTGRIDLFLASLSRAAFTTIEAACEFINKRYP